MQWIIVKLFLMTILETLKKYIDFILILSLKNYRNLMFRETRKRDYFHSFEKKPRKIKMIKNSLI